MRQIILPEDKLNQLAQQASDRLYEGHYFKQGVIRGEELKSFANHEQINRFLLFQVYQVWNMQLTKLKHPYFDFDPPEIQETLKVLRNQLSRHISISQKEFKPMLRRAVYNNFKLILTPEEAFTTFFFNNREQLSIEEFERYTAFFSDFDFIVKNILRYHQKNNLNLVDKDTFFQKMQKIVNLYHQKTGSDVDQYRDELFQKLANRKLSEIVSEAETEERQRMMAMEAEKRKEEEMRLRAEQELRRKAEQELRRKAEEESRRKAEEESRRKAEEAENRRKAEEERRRVEEEARRKAEEEAKIKAEAERKRLEEEARRKAEEELARQREIEEQEKREKLRKTSLFESLSGSTEESFLDLDIDDEDQKSGASAPAKDRDSVMDFGFSNNLSDRKPSFPEVEKPANDYSYEAEEDKNSTSTQSPLETYLQRPEPKEEAPVARQETREVEEKEEKPRTIFDSIKAKKDNENSNGSGTTVFERDKKETTASFLDRFLNSKKEDAPKAEASRPPIEAEVKEVEKEPETPATNSVVDQQNTSAAPTVGDKLKEQTQSSGTVQVHENLNGNRKIKLNEIPIHKQYQFVQKVFEGNNVRFRIIVDKVNNANGKDEVEAILNKFVLSNESIDHNDSVVQEFLELLRNRF